jgi:hypothetical protein
MSGDCEFARPNTGTRILGFHQQVNLIEPRNDDLRALFYGLVARAPNVQAAALPSRAISSRR